MKQLTDTVRIFLVITLLSSPASFRANELCQTLAPISFYTTVVGCISLIISAFCKEKGDQFVYDSTPTEGDQTHITKRFYNKPRILIASCLMITLCGMLTFISAAICSPF